MIIESDGGKVLIDGEPIVLHQTLGEAIFKFLQNNDNMLIVFEPAKYKPNNRKPFKTAPAKVFGTETKLN